MNPQFDPTPGLRLPEPSLDPRPVPTAVHQPVPPQQAVWQQPMQPVIAQQAPQQPMAVASAPSQSTGSQLPAQGAKIDPMPTDENSVDEVWVNKARTIVEQFQSDPYNESNALSKIKAEYLKSRHNITTKLSDNHEL